MSPVQRLLVCLLIPASLAQIATIKQTPPVIVARLGSEALIIDCEQVTTDHNFMYWYHRGSNQGLKLIAYLQRNEEPNYEGDLKNLYKVGSRRGNQHSDLTIKTVTSQVQGVYFCASSFGPRDGNAQKLEFGAGTVLSVLGENEKQKPPSISIYRPSKRELEVQNFISLVCVASNFFPEHVKIRWFVNYAERINLYEPVPQRMSNSSAYSTSKRLTLTREEYFNPDSRFRCNAAFLDGNYSVSEEIKGETDCGISKESYTMYINQGKISYIMVLCKSGLYALVVLVLVWRKKVVASSY